MGRGARGAGLRIGRGAVGRRRDDRLKTYHRLRGCYREILEHPKERASLLLSAKGMN